MSVEKWEKFKLTELGTLARGKSKHRPRDAAFLYGGKYPFIQTGDVKNANHKIQTYTQTYSEEGLKQSKLWQPSTLCITIAANIADTAILTFPACFPDSVLGFVADQSKCDVDFIEYHLRHIKSEIRSHAIGSVQDNINLGTFEKLELQIPPLSTQRRIAAILTALDDKIELNRRMNETLEGIAQAVWGEWFGKEDTSDLIELGEVVELSPRISIASGDEVGYVEMKDVPEHGMCISGFVQKPFTSGSKFQLNDTLLARITPCLENGKTAFVNFLKPGERAFGSTEFIVMRAKEGISPYFIYLVAREENFRQFAINSMVGSSGRQRVQTEVLPSFEIAKPNTDDMVRFHQFAEPIFEHIHQNALQSRTLTALRDALLPRLMRGEVI